MATGTCKHCFFQHTLQDDPTPPDHLLLLSCACGAVYLVEIDHQGAVSLTESDILSRPRPGRIDADPNAFSNN